MTTAARQIRDLSREEALDRLGSISLGRIVFTRNALPEIRPVNHLLDGHAVIIRSHLGAAIVSAAAERGVVVAYEADNLDPVTHLGWSVIVTGTAYLIREPAAIAHYQQRLRPWIARDMDYVIAIGADLVTGIELTAIR
ncbi:pyridoxamine 5'-phosphate oxidase family protein [Acrocarpospora sp. B8E8]|uniref:pyridoxamine 5'-phosphate oxidase family protein n=1 Tax=Acrocarpospora sp. B8E8 TaxID=3153572 RepID=UPI00325E4F51